MKVNCQCGYSADLKEFKNGSKKIVKNGMKDDKRIKEDFTIQYYKCPKCGNISEEETGGNWSYIKDEEKICCENCGEEISEKTFNEYDGMCLNCFENDNE